MASCWRGLSYVLSECVPYASTATSSSNRTSQVQDAPAALSIVSTSTGPEDDSRLCAYVDTRSRVGSASSQGTRFVIVRPAMSDGTTEVPGGRLEPPVLFFPRAFIRPSGTIISPFGFKCPVCSKMVPYDETECHLVMCLTKPRLVYNEDVISEDKGECVICLEDLLQGDTIARLPCLCIYHKTCIEKWFQVNRICPEHPYD